MSARHALVSFILGCSALATFGLAAESSARRDANKESAAVAVVQSDDAAMRVQGEQRFRANCGRCHATPQKFPPRMMKTVLRHMRVRATITDEDMRMILAYMTQ
jgi:mono/diheme cytochrome c family protein